MSGEITSVWVETTTPGNENYKESERISCLRREGKV